MSRLLARLLFLALRAALGHDLAVSVIGDLEIVTAAVGVLVMALVASVPARRAVRLQPTDALRVE